MAKELNVGIVGLGMGMHHCMAAEKGKGVNLAAVCDTDEKRLKEAVKKYDCKGYNKYADMLKDKSIDIVCVVTESGTHAEVGIKAAKAGKHILMEKPVEITPARIKKLRDVVRQTGVTAGCIFQSRVEPVNVRLKKAIDKNKLGKLVSVHGHLPWYREQSYYQGVHGTWKGTWKLDGGGSLMNQGIHTVDLLQWLAGPVESVCGFSGVFAHDIESEDQTVAILKFENGAFGTLFTTTCAMPDKGQRVYITGDKGSFSKTDHLEYFEAGGKKERENMMKWYGPKKKKGSAIGSDPMAVSSDGHTLLLEDLAKAIRAKREPAITIESATHAVEIACAIFKSGKTGKIVRVSDMKK
jgi:UDP-N-acetyl-2-amino-2-deoxyglucuronate dehydrogenase